MADVAVNTGRDEALGILPLKNGRYLGRWAGPSEAAQKDNTPYDQDGGYDQQEPRNELLRAEGVNKPVRSVEYNQSEYGFEGEEAGEAVGCRMEKRPSRHPEDRNG